MPTQILRAAWKALLLALMSAAVPPVVVGRELPQQDYDLIIEHGRVVDGTGAPWYAADVGIRAGHIVAIGRLDKASAKQRIDAAGRVVAPGFIDMLGQSEMTLLVDPHAPSKVFQGITTEITGEGTPSRPSTTPLPRRARPSSSTTRSNGIGRTSQATLRGWNGRVSASTLPPMWVPPRCARW